MTTGNLYYVTVAHNITYRCATQCRACVFFCSHHCRCVATHRSRRRGSSFYTIAITRACTIRAICTRRDNNIIITIYRYSVGLLHYNTADLCIAVMFSREEHVRNGWKFKKNYEQNKTVEWSSVGGGWWFSQSARARTHSRVGFRSRSRGHWNKRSAYTGQRGREKVKRLKRTARRVCKQRIYDRRRYYAFTKLLLL